MNHVDLDQLADVIESHWPHPVLTDLDRGLMARSLHDVTFDEAMAAVDRLVADGREYQPRAPQLLAAVQEVRRDQRRQAAQALPAPEAPPVDPHAAERFAAIVARIRGGMTVDTTSPSA